MAADAGSVAIVTNAREYAGAPVAAALAADGAAVLCHGPAFAVPEARQAYDEAHPGPQRRGRAASPGPRRRGRVALRAPRRRSQQRRLPARQTPIEEETADGFRAALEALLVAPFRLASAAAGG